MSHFTEVKTRLVQKDYLLLALRELGLKVEEFTHIRGYLGNREMVEIKVPSPNPEYDIGFRRNGETFEMIADWNELKRFDKNKFLQEITQKYACQAAKAELQKQGFTLAQEEQTEDGRVHLVLRRMA